MEKIENKTYTEQAPPVSAAIPDLSKEVNQSVKAEAKEKLKNELKDAKDKNFAEPVLGYLLKRCEEDLGLAQDVVQKHKNWGKCIDYIYGQARKQAIKNRAAVRDDVVFEWAEDYFHKNDKAEEEKKAKKEVSKKPDQKKKTERTVNTKEKPVKENVSPKIEEKPKQKKNDDIDGQIDIFSLLDM